MSEHSAEKDAPVGVPTQTCQSCGRWEVVRQDGRGFPPDIAKRRLAKACKANGCTSDPKYRAGLRFGSPAQGMATRVTPPEGVDQ